MFYLLWSEPIIPYRFLSLLGRLDPETGESLCRLAILKAYFVLINWLIN